MTLISFSLLFILAAIALKDFREGIIPDLWLVLLICLGFLQFGITHGLSVIVLGAIGYGLYKLYPLLQRRDGLGFGDVKMMAAAGLWLPISSLPLFLMITGSVGILIALLWRLLYKSFQFPLGPALALALGLCTLGNNVFSTGEIKMAHVFSGPSLSPAAGGKPDSLVVLIHGYGANGDDLLSLGKVWAPLLPNTVFVAPHGPFMCEMNPSGKQWFGLEDWEPTRILKEIQHITPAFNRYLDDLLKLYDLPPEKLALVGFSQGAMLSLHIALLRPQCGGVVAYSGAFLEDPTEFKIARPPVLLVHGTEDPVLPASFSKTAETRLKTIGVPVTFSLLPHLEHSIDERGLGLGGAFLKQHLYDTN
ncbi:MAG: prepilin peptidase [Proteobacteria bacterium]|nr:prepilin peptidase [Pseudomonadota bacterium]